MNGIVASGVRSTVTTIAVAAALVVMPVAGATVPANAMPGSGSTFASPVLLDDPSPGDPSDGDAPTSPNDPRCIQMPLSPICHGGPYYQGPPTGPDDPQCARMPGDGVCAGGPYAPKPMDPVAPPIVAAPPPEAPHVDAPQLPEAPHIDAPQMPEMHFPSEPGHI
ncbi:hypothetical protein PJK45_12540 [Mycobacterium kansasii]|uniref:IgA FC receptor n=2 Tax=Mycobacterium kansasii TaxID=1768 RepID=A0A653EG48_MYCKA|nr:hypothetical protein [Mycobacterium kansasii]EUA19574.1 hypothetical protein I545_2441 [Mycobacterium kansasii 662]KEP40377.1 hypothetical protein MKSMC1_44930 [Mycobacterium kansasii]MXO40156.1 hypothetical protein [Mycobacterium kansasii]UCA20318.1 hypothetical protein LA359_02525 [Mycobacterium kansasii]UGT80375.1 hypothetical protein LTS70_22920 [Mycobacterium kansasii]